MHVLGFSHEQNRRDREKYIRINYENIRPGVRRNFEIFPDGLLCSHYDYCSVMHYSSTAFSVSTAVLQSPALCQLCVNIKYFTEELQTNHHGTGASSGLLTRTEGRSLRAGFEEGQQSVRLQGIPEGGTQSGAESQGDSISSYRREE